METYLREYRQYVSSIIVQNEYYRPHKVVVF